MVQKLRLGIAGLGTVGVGVIEILRRQKELLALRSGVEFVITRVSAQDLTKDRGIDLSGIQLVADPVSLAQAMDVDIIVECMGGSEGPARNLVEQALTAGKHVVTANKALIAYHGLELAKLAERHHVYLGFEAAVAGGIPIIHALREGLAANSYQRVVGILNGTCNYILTAMGQDQRAFKDVLAEAQALGYAEADPSFDIDGVDTAHKLAILTSLAFGVPVNLDAMAIEGIRGIDVVDIGYAAELGYKVKLLGICGATDGGIEQRVHPCLVKSDAPIATVDGVFNAVYVEGDAVGKTLMEGRGAGRGPTASSIVADILDIGRGKTGYPFGVPAMSLKSGSFVPLSKRIGDYYLRFKVYDQPGVLAEIAQVLSAEEISVESVIQKARKPNEPVDLVLTTHHTVEARMMRALETLKKSAMMVEAPRYLRIESL